VQELTRQIEWNVSFLMLVLLYAGSFLAFALSGWRLYRRAKIWKTGRRYPLQTSPVTALKSVLGWLFNRSKMPRDRWAALMHSLILWGFIVLFIGTTLVFLEHQTALHFYYGTFYLVASAILDAGGVAFLVGLCMAFYRRHFAGNTRIKPSGWVDAMILLLVAIAITGFLVEGTRIAVTLPTFERVSFVGYSLALLERALLEPIHLPLLHRISWILHALLCISFFAAATDYFFRHAILSIASVALRPDRLSAQLRDYLPTPNRIPAGTVQDILWKDLLDGDACTTCGRCTSVCPATTAEKTLDPRAVVLSLSSLVTRQLSSRTAAAVPPSAFDSISDSSIWDCTTCGACVFECPVNIEVYDKIVDLRRQLVDIGRVSGSARRALDGLRERRNPWAYAPGKRAEWSEGLKLPQASPGESPEWIYWIGCAGSFEASAQSISRSMVNLLKHANVSFVTLGCEERCTGDPARRLGDEALFQNFKASNLETLRKHGAKKIVTHCPHCLNSLKNEYVEKGVQEFTVLHHSQLLASLVTEGKIVFSAANDEVNDITFHDPCYLGRHNGEFQAPRDIVKAIPGSRLHEMERTHEKSFCCGGGGGQMWLESSGQQRVENLRFSEAVETGASVVATACPFCKVMLESAAATAGKQDIVAIRDIAELLNEGIGR
jgi:Fe-S oxidoreductase/nitrate reductase gamma subunit